MLLLIMIILSLKDFLNINFPNAGQKTMFTWFAVGSIVDSLIKLLMDITELNKSK